MIRMVFILILTIILAAGIIFNSYQSSAQKQKTARMNVNYARRAVNTGQKPAETEELIKFRYESGLKISDLENYEKSPGNRESFSKEIYNDPANMAKAKSELNVEKKK